MADRVPIVRDLDAADSKWPAVREAVRIVANANPLVRRLGSLFYPPALSGRRVRLESLTHLGFL